MQKHPILALWIAILLVSTTACAHLATPATQAEEPQPSVTTTVSAIDKYGNVIFAMPNAELQNQGFAAGDLVSLTIGSHQVEAPVGTAYSDVAVGSPVLVLYKDGRLIAALNMRSMAQASNAQAGDPVVVTLARKGGYLSQYTSRHLTIRTERSQFPSDEAFANFRAVKAGKIAPKRLYRSLNPTLDQDSSRMADRLLGQAGIKTIYDQADKDFPDLSGAPNYQALLDKGQVFGRVAPVSYLSDEYTSQFHDGLLFMIEHAGPYLIHCNEGKDRTGFACMVLGAFMGGTIQELKDDYMQSFVNAYGLEKESEGYQLIEQAVPDMLASLNDGKPCTDKTVQKVATRYLKERVGLTETELKALKEALS